MTFNFLKKKKNRIHLDYASTTPVRAEVLQAMLPYFSDMWANPNAIYKEGMAVRAVIEGERTQLARMLHVRPEDITFTSGGTESNNLALIGYVEKLHESGRAYESMEVITSRIEHPSILETLHVLEKRGVCVTYAPVNAEGLIDTKIFETLLHENTVLVSFAYVNSEIGVVQDIKKISRMVRRWNERHGDQKIFVHVDACQAPLWLPCMPDMLGADMLTLDAGKCYGPKGAGVLVHRHWVSLAPILLGGGQERGLRNGTENAALIVGCVRSLIVAQKEWETRASRIQKLREHCIALLQKEIPGIIVNGSREARVANNINISIPGVDTEDATIWLDAQGIAVSTKSGCATGDSAGSTVVREISGDDTRARATLRITLGEDSIKEEIDTLVSKLKTFLHTMQLQSSK